MRFAYLLFTGLFIIPWLIFFLIRKDLRKEMLWASLIVGVLGLIAEKQWYTQDWVNPTTLTNTVIGIEDFILGFSSGGIAAVIFKDIFKIDDYNCKLHRVKNHWKMIVIFLIGLVITDSIFRFFGVFTFYANLIGFGLIALIMILQRLDLFKEAMVGGLLLVLVSLPIYWITFYIFPTWRDAYWRIESISGVNFLSVPYEDLVWWFLAGVNIAIAYDCYYGHCLRKLPAPKG